MIKEIHLRKFGALSLTLSSRQLFSFKCLVVKKQKSTTVLKEVEKLEPSFFAGGDISDAATVENSMVGVSF